MRGRRARGPRDRASTPGTTSAGTTAWTAGASRRSARSRTARTTSTGGSSGSRRGRARPPAGPATRVARGRGGEAPPLHLEHARRRAVLPRGRRARLRDARNPLDASDARRDAGLAGAFLRRGPAALFRGLGGNRGAHDPRRGRGPLPAPSLLPDARRLDRRRRDLPDPGAARPRGSSRSGTRFPRARWPERACAAAAARSPPAGRKARADRDRLPRSNATKSGSEDEDTEVRRRRLPGLLRGLLLTAPAVFLAVPASRAVHHRRQVPRRSSTPAPPTPLPGRSGPLHQLFVLQQLGCRRVQPVGGSDRDRQRLFSGQRQTPASKPEYRRRRTFRHRSNQAGLLLRPGRFGSSFVRRLEPHREAVDGDPSSGGSLVPGGSATFSITCIVDTIMASLGNKVNWVAFAPNPISPGAPMTMTVGGNTGPIGAAHVLSFTPAARADWPADVYELFRTSVDITGYANTPYANTLLVPASDVHDAEADYSATYSFVVNSLVFGITPVSPLLYSSSGNPVKHSDPSDFAGIFVPCRPGRRQRRRPRARRRTRPRGLRPRRPRPLRRGRRLARRPILRRIRPPGRRQARRPTHQRIPRRTRRPDPDATTPTATPTNTPTRTPTALRPELPTPTLTPTPRAAGWPSAWTPRRRGLSDGNGILEPGESVIVNPSWKNVSGDPINLSGATSDYTGPAGPVYSLQDATADYGSLAPRRRPTARRRRGNCYEVGISSQFRAPGDALGHDAHGDAIRRASRRRSGRSMSGRASPTCREPTRSTRSSSGFSTSESRPAAR